MTGVPFSDGREREEVMRLLGLYYTEEEQVLWLARAHPQLNGEKPRDVIAQGRVDEVLAILRRLESDAYL